MTSPDPKSAPKSDPSSQSDAEGGGILPALLAGAGILAVAALFIFGGDGKDGADATQAQDDAAHSASAQTAKGPKGGVAARQTDEANNNSGSGKPRLNPRIANAVVTEGMAPTPTKEPDPTSFASVEEEIAYWEGELDQANRMLDVRKRAQGHVPSQEAKVRESGSPEEIERFEERKRIVQANLDRAQARVDEVEGKLAALR